MCNDDTFLTGRRTDLCTAKVEHVITDFCCSRLLFQWLWEASLRDLSGAVNKYISVEQTQFDWSTNGCLEHLADFSTAGSNVICARALLTNVHYTLTYSTLHWFRLFLQTARAFRAHLRLPSQLSDCNGNLIELQSTYAKKKREKKKHILSILWRWKGSVRAW